MLLVNAVANLEALDEDSVLCARKPWTAQSETEVVTLEVDTLKIPATVKAAGLEYFLEVHVAKEVLQVLRGRDVPVADRIRLLIHYAENDAYPDWVYRTS